MGSRFGPNCYVMEETREYKSQSPLDGVKVRTEKDENAKLSELNVSQSPLDGVKVRTFDHSPY